MRTRSLVAATLCLLLTQSAFAVKVADITRMDGARTNVLTGMGLVIGLKGTGDGGACLPAMRPLANMLKAYADPSSIADLSNASNVAIVNVIATIPANGVRNGDHLDVRVMSNGVASSLKNGTLYMASMKGPGGEMYIRHDAKGNELYGSVDAVDLGHVAHGVTGLTDHFIRGVQHVTDRGAQPRMPVRRATLARIIQIAPVH